LSEESAPTSAAPAKKAPPRWRRWLLEAAIFLAALVAFQMWQLRDTVRGPAPEIIAQRLDGSAFRLADWRAAQPGRATLLYFWAEWCPVCRTTAGNVTALAEDWPLTSIVSQSGEAASIVRLMQERGYAWPSVVDARGEIMKQYGLPGVPGFVIIAPNGEIRFVSVGYTSELGLRLRLWWASRG
jgi:thiol-disulfide isomerase/thioredoxin